VWGPRSAAKSQDMAIPVLLPPNIDALKVTVQSCESLRPDRPIALDQGGYVINYRELLDTNANVIEQTTDGEPVLIQHDKQLYLAAWLDQTCWQRVVKSVCGMANVPTLDMPEGVRCRNTGTHLFWFNYDNKHHHVSEEVLEPGGVLIQ
nr:hypothetical protein [Oceanospirillaceae bacterium]